MRAGAADESLEVFRDRDGDLYERPAAQHDHACDRGWLGEDQDGRPIPCRACRPWASEHRPPTTAERRRAAGRGTLTP